jgi:hypothetical protein
VGRLGLCALLLLACRPAALNAGDGALRVDASVDFGDVWLDARVAKGLTLDNAGQAPLDLTFTVDAPFEAPMPVHLGGGATLAVEPAFSPVALGRAQQTLTIHSAQGLATVVLQGNGVQPPPCRASACRTATLDPKTGTCAQTPRPDGTVCSTACLMDATCVAGDCIGTAVSSCDDGDPCTTDACDPLSGCVHAPAVCASDDPCNAPACDPVMGCAAHPAPDGTACGVADCATARVCIAGTCVTRAVPDGAACGPSSICQSAGICQAQQCVQAPPAMIMRSWMYVPAPNSELTAMVGDGEDHLFITECAYQPSFTSQCQLISFDATGAERWRTPFPHQLNNGGGALRDALLIAGGLVVSTIGPDWVDAFNATNGKVAWSLDLETLHLFPTGGYPLVRPISVGFDGAQLVFALEGSIGGGVSGDAIVTLDLHTGALIHHVPLPAQGVGIVIDRDGLTYLAHSAGGTTWVDAVTAFDSAFGVRWQQTLPQVSDYIRLMLGTRGGELLLSAYDHSELLSTVDGSVETSALGAYWFSGMPVWGSNALFARHQYCAMPTCSGFLDYSIDLETVDDVTRVKHAAPLSPYDWASPSWLTANRTALLTLRPAVLGSKPEVREIDASGRVLMECPLQMSHSAIVAGPVLGNGTYAAITGENGYEGDEHLEVWTLGGYSPATSGWVSPRGGRFLDLREQ